MIKMQLKEFDELEANHEVDVDCQNFDAGEQKQFDSSHILGSCCGYLLEHSPVISLGLQNCSSSVSSLSGFHKNPKCRENDGCHMEEMCQDRFVSSYNDKEDRCICNNYVGISCSNSVSSTRSSMCDDELHTPDVVLEVDNEKDSPLTSSYASRVEELQLDSQLTPSYASRVEELQLDLLECALEYEVKILEMKMKMVQMRSNNEDPVPPPKIDQSIQQCHTRQLELPALSGQMEKLLAQRLDTCRRKINRLQSQRDSLAKELLDFRKKQRKFEMQRRNMEDLLRRVNSLQRKLTKKEEEMVECQLKEKEAKARLHELQMALQRSKARNYEPEQLIKLIPSLRTWLRSLKKSVPIKGNQRQLLQVEQFEAVLGRILENAPPELLRKQGLESTRIMKSTVRSPPTVEHNTPVDCIREVYELQRELQRLAAYR